MEKYKDLSDQIWTTRISRVNAEKRLINKEAFFQGINIYYSCVTIIFSILTLLNNNEKLSLMTVFMTISLLIVILYLNGQKYSEQAREYRKNYTELQKLEFELNNIDGDDVRCRYYYNVIWRFVLKICVIVLPVGLYWICGVL